MECLACFRPDLLLLAALGEIKGRDELAGFDVPAWVLPRAIGAAKVEGRFAEIYSPEWLSLLQVKLARTAAALGIQEINLSVLQAPAPRSLTQAASRVARSRKLDGMCYHSRFGSELENWALFEPWTLSLSTSTRILPGDPDLYAAIGRLGIRTGNGVS